ncbi:MAG: hypothetical protein Q4E69_03030 [Bacilli bacterium]|nr:hypothetical protein [Bacilli bacterium]
MDFETYIREVEGGLDFYSDNINDINGLLLTNKEIKVLKDYEIPYSSCNNLKEVIYLVEDKIDEYDSPEDLLEISDSISERDYYANTNK